MGMTGVTHKYFTVIPKLNSNTAFDHSRMDTLRK